MLIVKDYTECVEYKFDNKENIELFAIGYDVAGNKLITGVINDRGKKYFAEWELDGTLWRTTETFDGYDLDLIPYCHFNNCPFCESYSLVVSKTSEGNWSITCMSCDNFTNTFVKSKIEASKKWNRRKR